ncbi:MAG: FHA domain-containing protein [Microscillaceae bacterium]|nr:FHA domain-containing protein [Microscillaceae bacterium]
MNTTLRVGRAPDNDLVLDDPKISKYHLHLRWLASGQVEVEDMESANGTFVNQEKLPAYQARTLEGGDVLVLAETPLDWASLGPSTSTKPAPHEENATPRPAIDKKMSIIRHRNKTEGILKMGLLLFLGVLFTFLLVWYFNFVVRP